MLNLYRTAAAVLVAVSAVSAAAQSPPACVELPTKMRNVSTSRAGDTISTYSCAFDRQTVTQNCQVSTALPGGQSIQQTSAQTWTSVDDLVGQFKVNPPLNYSIRLVIGGSGTTRTTTYTYDAEKRVVREDNVSVGAKSTLTWSAWDAKGRPTKGKWTGEPAPYFDTDTISYDEGGRIMHREMSGAAATASDSEFDPQGRGIKTTARSAGGEVVSTMTIQAAEKICK